jgi:hypothetical protein
MRKPATTKNKSRGSALIEVAMCYGILLIVALLLLKASINSSATQLWTVKQTMSDAYMGQEMALAQRIAYQQIQAPSSLWAPFPSVSTKEVVVGKLPGGMPVTGVVYRTRIPDANNLPDAGGNGTADSNPARSEAWKLQSLLVYNVGDKEYVKSRTTLRIQ